jgi:hypothetical protein
MKRATPILFVSMIVASVATPGPTGCAEAASITTLASFDYYTTGNSVSGVVVDGQGNLFGVAHDGPPGYSGTVRGHGRFEHDHTPRLF